jgi:hypothetical protein
VALSVAIAGFWVRSRTWGSPRSIRTGRVDPRRTASDYRPRRVWSDGAGARSGRGNPEMCLKRQGDRRDSVHLPATAATHVKRVLRKTGLSSRRDLLLLAISQDLTRPTSATASTANGCGPLRSLRSSRHPIERDRLNPSKTCRSARFPDMCAIARDQLICATWGRGV